MCVPSVPAEHIAHWLWVYKGKGGGGISSTFFAHILEEPNYAH